jgi:hypothetical protein
VFSANSTEDMVVGLSVPNTGDLKVKVFAIDDFSTMNLMSNDLVEVIQ